MHHATQKRLKMNRLVHRTVSLSGANNLPVKLNHVRNNLPNNDYKKQDVQRSLNPRTTNINNVSHIFVAFLPYDD